MDQESLILECRSISIGSYLIDADPLMPMTPLNVVQSWKGMQFNVPHCTIGVRLNVGIRVLEISSIEAYFNDLNIFMNRLCIKTTENCAAWIRDRLGMWNVHTTNSTSENYCPLTGVSSENRITLMLSRNLSHSEKTMLRQIYGDILTEIVSGQNILTDRIKESHLIPMNISTPVKVNQESDETSGSKYFSQTPTRPKKPVKQVQVRNVMSSAFIDNLLSPSLLDFQIIYEKGAAKVKFTLKNY